MNIPSPLCGASVLTVELLTPTLTLHPDSKSQKVGTMGNCHRGTPPPSLPQAGSETGASLPKQLSCFSPSLPYSPSYEGLWPLPSIAWQPNLLPQTERNSTDAAGMRGLG